jgi:hypothetical protein
VVEHGIARSSGLVLAGSFRPTAIGGMDHVESRAGVNPHLAKNDVPEIYTSL